MCREPTAGHALPPSSMADDRLHAETAARLMWGSRGVARRAGVDDWGRPKPAGSDEQLLTAAGNGKHCTSSIGILIKVLDESSWGPDSRERSRAPMRALRRADSQ